jgi:hypothetical protein
VIQEHIEKESEARNPVLMKYLEKVSEMEKHFKGYSVQHIPIDDNNEADKLAKAVARNQELPPDVFFEIIRESSIKDSRAKIVNVVETPDWRAEIMAYLRGHYKPQDDLEEKRLKQRVRGYTIVNGELYKSGVTEPLTTVHHLRKRSGASKGNSQWILRGAHRHRGLGRKGNKAGILLANHKH